MVQRDFDQYRTCIGKVRYRTYKMAKRAARSARRRYGSAVGAYECRLCQGAHVGHHRQIQSVS